jgi:hypothetical protein
MVYFGWKKGRGLAPALGHTPTTLPYDHSVGDPNGLKPMGVGNFRPSPWPHGAMRP